MAYLGIIPARGGSKRIPDKNLVAIGGKPLIAHAIEAAAASKSLTRVVVSTEDTRIAEVARDRGSEVVCRPPEMARDESPVIDAILHVLHTIANGSVFNAIVLLQPTSPFRTGQHIDEAIGLYESSGADTVTSVRESSEHPYWCWTIRNGVFQPYFSRNRMSMGRESLPPAYVENGAIFVVKRSVITGKTMYGNKIVPYLMNRECSIDIDTPEDLFKARSIMGGKEAIAVDSGSQAM